MVFQGLTSPPIWRRGTVDPISPGKNRGCTALVELDFLEARQVVDLDNAFSAFLAALALWRAMQGS